MRLFINSERVQIVNTIMYVSTKTAQGGEIAKSGNVCLFMPSLTF